MTSEPTPVKTDLLPADLLKLLQVFADLPEVQFPDLTPGSLQLEVQQLHERHLQLLHLEAQAQSMQMALDEDQESLLKKGHRLLAYLRIFTEHDEHLAHELNAISLPRLRKATATSRGGDLLTIEGPPFPPPSPKRRNRARAQTATDALFADDTAATVSTS